MEEYNRDKNHKEVRQQRNLNETKNWFFKMIYKLF